MIALIAVAALLIILAVVSALRGRGNEDRLSEEQATASRAQDPEERCASQATYDLIKRELFRRAANVRGSDQAAFDKLAAYSALRVESPVLRGRDGDVSAINCSASLALDLPPGVAVVGGRRTLTAEIDYALQPAADGTGDVVTLGNADSIVTPLATLARTTQPAPVETPALGNETVTITNGMTSVTAPAPPTPVAPPQASPSPSFNCINARTRGEIAVCNNAELATLDRQMASQFGAALTRANPAQRALLERTRIRFIRYRDSCRSNSCIEDAYRGRVREIGDILADRWQP